MRACACGLVRMAPWSMPGREISSAYCARPVALPPASGRGGLAPTARAGLLMGTPRKLFRRFDDFYVAGAAAEISRERGPDGFAVRMRIARKQLGQGHHESRRAKAALDRSGVDERPLDGGEIFVAGNALDRRYRSIAHVDRERQARSG